MTGGVHVEGKTRRTKKIEAKLKSDFANRARAKKTRLNCLLCESPLPVHLALKVCMLIIENGFAVYFVDVCLLPAIRHQH